MIANFQPQEDYHFLRNEGGSQIYKTLASKKLRPLNLTSKILWHPTDTSCPLNSQKLYWISLSEKINTLSVVILWFLHFGGQWSSKISWPTLFFLKIYNPPPPHILEPFPHSRENDRSPHFKEDDSPKRYQEGNMGQ